MMYSVIVLTKGSEIFHTYTESNDYGVGIIGLVIGFCQFISIFMASILGIYLKRRRCISNIKDNKEN
ncbi:hypothetical protein BD780_000366 [Clostridium tetanomorphum]|uniref:Uncharacterized protein n=2 Tax=Clostridium tetanomorphum TaxID=1553 RepID=A0A923EB75_CLOTT|nr:hypothetical protein [Clostridium tetanomorphum]MBC2398524.1 hypothetical protein [Clostridium tetanomorphum]MBP1864935.1 hypothetical protein [Clostridium tetanomorphum]NRS83141.1 hypothetical protein [Clostridium tetanomorphum]NRZ98758.1 hypothetical protein [Clostridium tetanomorphum]SQC01186.1 Uncharacterised protein [Clostridium tetanomorphum]